MQIAGKDFMDWIHDERRKERKNFFQKPKTYLKELELQATRHLKLYGFFLQSEKAQKTQR